MSGRDLLTSIGPTLYVQIGFDPTYDPKMPNKAPELPAGLVPALVDTGSSESCIDADFAAIWNLPVVDKWSASGVHGAHPVNMHLAHIHVPTLGFTAHGLFAGVGLRVGGQHHKALIGRTTLQHFTMTYDGRTGNVTIST